MSLPGVSLEILKFGLGIVLPGQGRVQVKAGASSKGIMGTLYSAGSSRAATDAVGSGPMFEAALQALDHPAAASPVLMLPIDPTVYGTAPSTLDLVGSGTGTIAGKTGPEQVLKVKIHTGGTLGTMKFQVAIGSGAYGAAVTSDSESSGTDFSYMVPGAKFTTLHFETDTYVTGDVYTLNLDKTIARTGTGLATSLNDTVHSTVDAYRIQVVILTAGALGTAAFKYSTDGGHNFRGPIVTPSGGLFPIPGTGVILTFAGTFVKDDSYTGVAVTPDYEDADLTAALAALLLDATPWGLVHIVGTPATAAAALARAQIADSKMSSAENALREVHAVCEVPSDDTNTDAVVKAAFANFASSRVALAVSYADMTNPNSGKSDKRSAAWAVTARLGAVTISTNPGQVNLGLLHNVMGIYRDETATPGLDDAKFTTLRTFPGLRGYFVTDYHMFDEAGSDFRIGPNRRVMDVAATIAIAAYTLYVNSKVRINKTTGFIDERDAQQIDGNVTAKLQAGLQGDISSVIARLHRDDNLLSTSTVHFDVGVVPLGYLRRIEGTIGFRNPVLTTPTNQ